MITLQERYLVDAQGQRLGVFLDMTDCQKVLEALAKLDTLHEATEIAETKHSVGDFHDLALADDALLPTKLTNSPPIIT